MFNRAVDLLIKKEGGYVNDPLDPGGETKYGISKRSYPNLDIKNLTVAMASNIYYTDFWVKMGCQNIKDQKLATLVFITSVNMGTATVLAIINTLLSSRSLKSLNDLKPIDAIQIMQLLTIKRYVNMVNKKSTLHKFLLGWLNRVLDENFD